MATIDGRFKAPSRRVRAAINEERSSEAGWNGCVYGHYIHVCVHMYMYNMYTRILSRYGAIDAHD